MTPASATPHNGSGLAVPLRQDRPVCGSWPAAIAAIGALLRERGASASRTVVLLPQPALAAQARQAWAAVHAQGLVPRFATPRQWAEQLMAWQGGPEDLSRDPARDALVAEGWLERVVREGIEPGLRRELVGRLVDTAGQLAPQAAARPPQLRQAWAEAARASLGALGTGPARWESLVSHVALAWVGACGFETDVLWSPLARADADLLVLLPGHADDPLAQALCSAWGDSGHVLSWGAETPVPVQVQGQPCRDFEHEAMAAAACVLQHLNAGRAPVALIANDRLLTRRVSALLQGAGVHLRDEAGWKLSTTQAGAGLMALLRAAAPRASSDEVLDWLKLAPAFDGTAVGHCERVLRRHGVALWAAAPPDSRPEGVDGLLGGLQAPRPLVQWLRDVDAALRLSGQRAALETDSAGMQLLALLRLGDAAAEFDALGDSLGPGARRRWPLAQFSAWVREALEGAGFQPEVGGTPQVVVLPLAHRLGRALGAVVVPGCDERHLPVCPEPPGHWTAEQRRMLGLPDREALRAAADSAWASLFDGTPLDLLWRQWHEGEALLPSPRIESLALASPQAPPALLRREVPAGGTPPPQPRAPALVPDRISATAYEDLRRCPYRFFALRQLRLAEAEELDTSADARDLGNWLHAVLRRFHEQRGDPRPGEAADRAALDTLAEQVAADMGLAHEAGGDGGFLPYRAQWPGLREAYLRWLQAHEAEGNGFVAAEAERQATLGRWRLYGRLDRIDRSADGGTLLIDYKTERRDRTEARVRQPMEDTQLAFYAALVDEPGLRAGYLSLNDARDGTEDAALLIEQKELAAAREALQAGLPSDLDRIAAGATLHALGEGVSCDHCPARGLCRKEFTT